MSIQVEVEASAFNLLASLCGHSSKGVAGVTDAQNFKSAFDRAVTVVSDMMSDTACGGEQGCTSDNVGIINDDTAGSSVSEEEDTTVDRSSKTPLVEISETQGKLIFKNVKLFESAFSFLSSVLDVSHVRKNLLTNNAFVEVVSALVTDESQPVLQGKAVRVVSKLAAHSSGASLLSPEKIGTLLRAALAMEFSKCQSTLHVDAAEGIQIVFDSLSEPLQKLIVQVVAAQYSKLVKAYSLARVDTQGGSKLNGGELAHNLTTIMILAVCKDNFEVFFDSDVLRTLVSTSQWRYDPKTVISDEELYFWDAATAQCLKIFAFRLWKPNEKLSNSGIKLGVLKDNVAMVARQGKAPRKAIDFPSALKVAMTRGEATAKISARRLAKCLGLDHYF